MAFTITSTNASKRTFKKPTRILVVPLVQNTSDGTWSKGTYALAMDNIVADSTSITQDEAERNTIDCETRDEPIDESITLGSYQFKADNADWQDSIMTALLGFTKAANGNVYAPSSYVEKYVEIEIQFGDASTWTSSSDPGQFKGSIVLPKLLLSSAATMESLKTSTANMSIAGTAYAGTVKGVAGVESPFFFSPSPVNVASE